MGSWGALQLPEGLEGSRNLPMAPTRCPAHPCGSTVASSPSGQRTRGVCGLGSACPGLILGSGLGSEPNFSASSAPSSREWRLPAPVFPSSPAPGCPQLCHQQHLLPFALQSHFGASSQPLSHGIRSQRHPLLLTLGFLSPPRGWHWGQGQGQGIPAPGVPGAARAGRVARRGWGLSPELSHGRGSVGTRGQAGTGGGGAPLPPPQGSRCLYKNIKIK